MPASILPKRILNFVGREEYLKNIETIYLEENKNTVCLSSIAGTGKTTITNEFGYQFKSKQSSNSSFVYWVKSDNNNADNEFKQFALDLEINLDKKN